MTVLVNNQETQVGAGSYAFKATGALELQQQLFDEGFSTLADGDFLSATDGIVELAPGDIRIINAGANTFTFKLINK